jgi:hypothetical protein
LGIKIFTPQNLLFNIASSYVNKMKMKFSAIPYYSFGLVEEKQTINKLNA